MANGTFERRGHAPERAQRRHYHVPSMLFLTCFDEGRDARGMLIIDSRIRGALTGGSAMMPHLVSFGCTTECRLGTAVRTAKARICPCPCLSIV
jgi:hypothetical protein